LTIAVRDDVLREWCPPGLELVVAQTAAKVAVAVGAGHVEIASGAHDRALDDAGIGGLLARPKRQGLRLALQRLIEAMRSPKAGKIRAWLKVSAGWAKSAVTSIGSSIPGVELISEALDVVLSGIDTTEALGTVDGPSRSRRR